MAAGMAEEAVASTTEALEEASGGVQGPGLGNLRYEEAEAFQVVSWVDHDTGMPVPYPERQPFGTNRGAMVNGYFVTVFAPDGSFGPGGFLVYDVSDPRNIELVRRVYDPEGTTRKFREAHSLRIARINGSTYVAVQAHDGVEFWDFSDVENIFQASRAPLPGIEPGGYSGVWQLSWQAPYVYVAVAAKGMFIVDASDPTAPFVADRNTAGEPVPPSALGGFRVGPLFAMGNHLLLSSMRGGDGWSSVDISNPVQPVLLDKVPRLPNYYSMCFDGRRAYSSPRGRAKMVVYDLSDPGSFSLVNDQYGLGDEDYCATQDTFVFQGGSDAFTRST